MAIFQARAGEAQGGSVQEQITALQARVAELEQKLQDVSVSGTDMHITGANLYILNGLGATNGNPANPSTNVPSLVQTNRLGNPSSATTKSGPAMGHNGGGSHNLVVGAYHDYASFGGLVAGRFNSITGSATHGWSAGCIGSAVFAGRFRS